MNKETSNNMELQSSADYEGPTLYAGVRGIAVKVLNRIDRTDAYLDKMLEIEMKTAELSGVDKALLFEIVHGVIRWLGRIDWILNGFYKGQFSKCIPNVKNSMRVALYQILFLDKVPHYAAVNESVEFVKKLQGQKSADLTNAVLRSIIRKKDAIKYPDKEEDIVGYLAAYYSHPGWMVKRWLNRFGEDFTKELLEANNQKPALTIRVNRLVTTKSELVSQINKVKLGFESTKYLPDFIKLRSLSNITDWDLFKEGHFTIQDESTGFACHLLDVKPGMKVLDFCSAPGGKTAFLADLMNNEGEIYALDKFESRMKILEKNMERLQIKNVKTVVGDANNFKDKDFDRILLDAPCSGLGTLTKKPDIKWKRDIGDFRKLNRTQKELLESASSLLKPGGELVYSTCTTEPEENINIVNDFISSHDDFEIAEITNPLFAKVADKENFIQTYPNLHGMDGAFAIKIRKKN